MTTKNPNEQSSTGFYAIVALVIVGMGVAAFFAINNRGAGDGGRAEFETAPVEVDGAPLEVFEAGAADPSVGQVAPTLSGTTYSNESITIEPDGRPKVVLFVTHWCSHCQAEVPRVQALVDAGELNTDVDLYAVSTSVDRGRVNYPPSSWLKNENWTSPVMADSETSSAATAYGLSGFPYFVVLDGDHQVLARYSGEQSEDNLRIIFDAAAAGGAVGDDLSSDKSSEG